MVIQFLHPTSGLKDTLEHKDTLKKERQRASERWKKHFDIWAKAMSFIGVQRAKGGLRHLFRFCSATVDAFAQKSSEQSGFLQTAACGFRVCGLYIRHNGSVSLSAHLGLWLWDNRHFKSENKRASKHMILCDHFTHFWGPVRKVLCTSGEFLDMREAIVFNCQPRVNKASLRVSGQTLMVVNCSVCIVIQSVSKSDSTRPLILFHPSFDNLFHPSFDHLFGASACEKST